MFLIITVVAAILANVEAFTKENANQYIDDVLTNRLVNEVEYHRLDPFRFPDFKIDLESRKLMESYAFLQKGALLNLSKVKRNGDCSVPQWTFANVTFTCNLSFDSLRVNYTANVTYDNMQIIFYPRTSIEGTRVKIQVTTARYENIPDLKMFVVDSIGKMNVTVKMISIGDVANRIEPHVKSALVSNITSNLDKVLNGRFKDALGYSIFKTPVTFVE